MKFNKSNLNTEQIKNQFSLMLANESSLTVNGKKMKYRPAKLILMLLAGLICLVILINLLLIPSRMPKTIKMTFESGSNYTMMPYQNDLLIYNNRHISSVSPNGNPVWNIDKPLSIPDVSYANDYVLAVDLSGNNYAALYKNGEFLYEFKLGNDIIAADVNKNGDCAFATAIGGYKGRAVVYNKKGKELFSWNSGEGYITDLSINENGSKLAVSQLLSNDEITNTSSRIQFIDINRKKVTKTADCPNSLIAEIRFSGKNLLSVSDRELKGFSSSGRELYSVSFVGKKPEKYDISSDELLVFVTRDNRGNSVLELYNTNGKLKGTYVTGNSINNLALCDDMVIITRNRDLLYINKHGKLKKTKTSSHDIKSIGIFGDNQTVMAAGSTDADIIKMR